MFSVIWNRDDTYIQYNKNTYKIYHEQRIIYFYILRTLQHIYENVPWRHFAYYFVHGTWNKYIAINNNNNKNKKHIILFDKWRIVYLPIFDIKWKKKLQFANDAQSNP